MIPESKLYDILERLLVKSRANQVNWNRGDPDTFFVKFSSGDSIDVRYSSPESDADWVRASLWTKNGDALGAIAAHDGDAGYELLKSLYDEAARCVVGWDKAIEGIDSELASDKVIGQQTLREDDIPF